MQVSQKPYASLKELSDGLLRESVQTLGQRTARTVRKPVPGVVVLRLGSSEQSERLIAFGERGNRGHDLGKLLNAFGTLGTLDALDAVDSPHIAGTLTVVDTPNDAGIRMKVGESLEIVDAGHHTTLGVTLSLLAFSTAVLITVR